MIIENDDGSTTVFRNRGAEQRQPQEDCPVDWPPPVAAHAYEVTRTRLLVERIRVEADSEEQALETIGDELDGVTESDNCRVLEVHTESSETEIKEVR